MLFEPLPLSGAFRIKLEKHEDSRGTFARTFCAREFAAERLNTAWVQCNTSYNKSTGTLRGLHWAVPPEIKLVRVTRGAVWDVLVDLRPDSPTFRKWHGEILDVENGTMFYIPEGFAHGFATLRPDTEILYMMSGFYNPASARGARFDDPAFGITWPVTEGIVVSEQDRAFPPFIPK